MTLSLTRRDWLSRASGGFGAVALAGLWNELQAAPTDPLAPRAGHFKAKADRVIFMDQGKIVEDCTRDEFFGAPRSARAQEFLSKILSH